MISVRHSGDLGDVLYALPAIRWLCSQRQDQCELHLESASYTTQRMTPELIALIAPLLLAQPYVASVRPWTGEPVDFNLNDFRAVLFPALKRNAKVAVRVRLTDWQAGVVGAPAACADEAWLSVPPRPVAEYVINRTSRYQNPRFPWKRIIGELESKMVVFVGTVEEHRTFKTEVAPWVLRYPTADLLSAAQVIAGADCFIGNQSACYAIAEGLKKPALIEVFPPMPNCLFSRESVVHGWDELASLPGIPRTNAPVSGTSSGR